VLAAGAIVFGLVLWGGYGHHWPWTGINGSTATLWDWLHLLLLPIAFGLLPILLNRRLRLRSQHKVLGAAALCCLGLLVFAGYVIPWAWTGFEGNKLWDWLELLALPLAVTLIPLMGDLRARWGRRESIIALLGLALFVAVVVGGYVGNWSWTGFRGNTLWDWLHLLLLPLLLPTLVVPALASATAAGMVVVEEEEEERQSSAPEPSNAMGARGGQISINQEMGD
jgi:hypothetical protein